jgi:ribosomal protein L40E
VRPPRKVIKLRSLVFRDGSGSWRRFSSFSPAASCTTILAVQSLPPLFVMASNRSNLALDEQSFQGLLAAAFTIQEHNDRANAGLDFPGNTGSTLPKPEPPKVCSKCGAQLPSAEASCPICHDGGLRPGERLQRNWASMWLMSQDLNLNTSGQRQEGDLPLSPADPGPARHVSVEPNAAREESALAAWPVGENAVAVSHNLDLAEPAGEANENLTIVEDSPPELETEPSISEADEVVADEPRGPRVRLRFQRADLYLGLAVLVLAGALLWPTGPSKEPKMPMWERMLIAMGIADEPQPVTHYHGDPDLKVWVDTHTALYYCPGDELYGKSVGGYYSTQRDAQSDHFEPAERSVCVE